MFKINDKSIYTHGWEIFGFIFAVGLPLHYFIWRDE
tara:strand:+ start:568 stop:675 length:108 start_codon:yes stop_codon:yes gene_type:complete